MNALVSIILPTYNRESLLPKAIKSIIAQTYPHWELMIIDDGSVDGTRDLVGSFSKDDKRIHYIYQQNQGQGNARNAGIRMSKGEFITFIDSDDEYLPEKIEKQLAVALLPGAKPFIVCGSKWQYSNGKMKIKTPIQKPDLKTSLLKRELNGAVHTMAYFFKREFLEKEKLYFDTTLPTYDDWELIFRTSSVTTYDIVPDPLFIYFIHGNSIHNPKNRIRAILILFEKYRNDFLSDPEIKDKWVWPCIKLAFYHKYKKELNELLEIAQLGKIRNGIFNFVFMINCKVPYMYKVIYRFL